MKIGTVREIKDNTETRVGLTPQTIKELTALGHEVLVEKGAGLKSQISDEEYTLAGAEIVEEAKSVWEGVDLMVKVKEPQKEEFEYLREDLILFTYLHLANPANKELTERCVESKGTFIAYETIVLEDRTIPLLAPMSEVAGHRIIDICSEYLASPKGLSNKMINRIRGKAGKVLIIGGGVVGEASAHCALGRGADVVVLELREDKRIELQARLQPLADAFGAGLKILESTKEVLGQELENADIIIGSIYIKGTRADRLIKTEMLDIMKEGAVIGDVAIDQGGVCEFSKITHINHPEIIVEGPQTGKKIIYIGIPNIPGTVGATSTHALNTATREYVKKIAEGGMKAILSDSGLRQGVNVINGYITLEPVAKEHGFNDKFKSLDEAAN
ncbi:MAG: alanine dehydrogenase [Patescibacteria group bacterium]